MYIKDHVTIVRHYTLTVFRTTAQLHQLASHSAARHWDHFNRQREVTENIDFFGRVGNTDKFLRHGSNNFFTGQRCAAALDHLHVAVDFIRAVNVYAEAVHFVKIEHVDTEAFEFFG